jgi:predicted Zn-dependent protease
VLPDPGKTRMSREKQLEIGQETAAEVYKQLPILPDNSLETQYIRKPGRRLTAATPPETSWPFEFHVVPQKDINAFALPGGKMFINIGTIIAAQSETQLAGVMAHEIAHVYKQHSAKRTEKRTLTSGLAGLTGSLLGIEKPKHAFTLNSPAR